MKADRPSLPLAERCGNFRPVNPSFIILPGAMKPRFTDRDIITLRLPNKAGVLGHLSSAIRKAGASIGAADIVEAGSDHVGRDVTATAGNDQHAHETAGVVSALPDVTLLNSSGRVFLLNIGG
jgi:hypothetical protein